LVCKCFFHFHNWSKILLFQHHNMFDRLVWICFCSLTTFSFDFSLASAFWCSYTKSIHPSTQTAIHTHRKYSETQITPTLKKAQPHLATFIIVLLIW
jgi:hypothetical protein